MACSALDLKPIRTRPYTPRTNGKAERFIQTLCREWAYGMSFQNSEERNRWLAARYLALYIRLRQHSALSWNSQQQPVAPLRSVNSNGSQRCCWRPSEWCKSPGPQPGVAGLSVRTSGDRLHG